MRDLIDSVLDNCGGLAGLTFLGGAAFVLGSVVWATSSPRPSAEVDYNAEYNARVRARQAAQHAERMDRHMITGRYTPQEAEEAIERNDAIISYWENR